MFRSKDGSPKLEGEMLSDNEYIESVLAGNTEAFSKLVYKYQNVLYCFVYKLTFSKEDAEDISQEAFIKAYNHLYKYDNRWAFATWLYKNVKKRTIYL